MFLAETIDIFLQFLQYFKQVTKMSKVSFIIWMFHISWDNMQFGFLLGNVTNVFFFFFSFSHIISILPKGVKM